MQFLGAIGRDKSPGGDRTHGRNEDDAHKCSTA